MPAVVVPGPDPYPGLDPFLERFQPWATLDDVRCCDDLVASRPDDVTVNLAAASWLLWVLTGRQYGVETLHLRPCRWQEPIPPAPWQVGYPIPSGSIGGWLPAGDYLYGLDARALGCGHRTRGCNCTGADRIWLGGLPGDRIVSVDQVYEDGVIIDESRYQLETNRKWLAKVDGTRWPVCTNPYLPLTKEGTLGVTVRAGRVPPAMARQATAELACELTKSGCDSGDCRLPVRTTQVSRNGMTIAVADPMEFLDKGVTGMGGAIDMFIVAANPNRLRRRARVTSAEQVLAR